MLGKLFDDRYFTFKMHSKYVKHTLTAQWAINRNYVCHSEFVYRTTNVYAQMYLLYILTINIRQSAFNIGSIEKPQWNWNRLFSDQKKTALDIFYLKHQNY